VDNIKTDLQDTWWRTWIGLIWLRTRTYSRILKTWRNFGFDKMCRVCWLDKELLASQGPYSMQLSSPLATYHKIFSFHFLVLLKKSCSCVNANTENSPCFPP